jgi:hypothetical protein
MTISAGNGFYYTTANTAVTEKHYGIVVVGDTVLTAWTDSEGTDLLAKFNITGVTLTSDFPPLIIPGGLASTNIRAASTNGGICLLRA